MTSLSFYCTYLVLIFTIFQSIYTLSEAAELRSPPSKPSSASPNDQPNDEISADSRESEHLVNVVAGNRFDLRATESRQTESLPFSSMLSGGAKYGLPISPSQAVGLNLPKTIQGSCEAGTVYTITSASDLHKYKSELQCVFTAAVLPDVVPTGIYYGDVLGFLNTGLFAPILAAFWKGKLASATKCRGDDVFLTFNIVADMPILPALLSLGNLEESLAPGEFEDGRGGFLIDYTKDFGVQCPDTLNLFYGNKNLNWAFLNNPYPFNQIMDVVRYVGRAPDGGSILLGKTFLRDAFQKTRQAATIAYWSIVVYDPLLNVNFTSGQSLPPLPISFKYMYPGLGDFIFRILPLDNAVLNPILTFQRFIELVRGFKNTEVALKAASFSRGISSSVENLIRFQSYLISTLAALLSQAKPIPSSAISPVIGLQGVGGGSLMSSLGLGNILSFIPQIGNVASSLFGFRGIEDLPSPPSALVEGLSVQHEDAVAEHEGSTDGGSNRGSLSGVASDDVDVVERSNEQSEQPTIDALFSGLGSTSLSVTKAIDSLIAAPTTAAKSLTSIFNLPERLAMRDGGRELALPTTQLIESLASSLQTFLVPSSQL